MSTALKYVYGSAVGMFATGLWFKTKNGEFGRKQLHFTNNLRREFDVIQFTDNASLMPHKAMIIEKTDIAHILCGLRQMPDHDWRTWSAFVNIKVISSLQPFEVTIEDIPERAHYVKLLEEATNNIASPIRAQQAAIEKWIQAHPINGEALNMYLQ